MGTVLVTGGGGFIGRALVRHLADVGVAAVAPPRGTLDLLDSLTTAAMMEKVAPTAVVHLASPGVLGPADAADLVSRELAMAHNLVDALPVGARLIHAGSMAEYGTSGRHRESDPCRPRNAYAEAKHRAGQLVLDAGARRGLAVTVARIFGAYGPGEAPSRLLPAVLRALARGEAVALSDGGQYRDFVHVADVARALAALAVACSPVPSIVNIGTGHALSVRAVLTRLAAQMGAPEALLRFGAIARSPHDQDRLEADTDLLARTIGWVPPDRLSANASIASLMTWSHFDQSIIMAAAAIRR